MPEPASAGPLNHILEVTCDLDSLTLRLATPEITIQPGDQIVWHFNGIPAGWSPVLEFKPLPEEDGKGFALGPLASLAQSAAALWGACAVDNPHLPGKRFVYRLAIQRGAGTGWGNEAILIRSGAGVLAVEPAGRALRTFTVNVEEGTEPGAPPALRVDPLGLTLYGGQVVELVFQGVPLAPGSWRPRIDFERYTGDGEVPNLFFGPFTNLVSGTDRIRCTGNNGVPGTYFFRASVIVAESGVLYAVTSHDPAVDNRGPAGDPSSGGGSGY